MVDELVVEDRAQENRPATDDVVELVIQSRAAIDEVVEDRVDGDVNIDDVVLARQKKLDKGKSVMTPKHKPRSQKTNNGVRGTDISIKENTNPVSSESESKGFAFPSNIDWLDDDSTESEDWQEVGTKGG